MKDEATKEVINHGIDRIEEYKGQDIDASDIHHHLYNEDYFIIGYHKAEEFLKKYGVFAAIEKVKTYEQENFGEVSTDFSSSENVANMFAYIVGEEVLNDCETLRKADGVLTDKQIDAIKSELEAQL